MRITTGCVERIQQSAVLQEIIADFYPLHRSGKDLTTTCPKCGKGGKGKGLMVSAAKQIFKCFHCDFSGKSAIEFLMQTQGKTYPEALVYIAGKYGITIEEEKPKRGPQTKGNLKDLIDTFRDRQLKASGLTDADQKATVYIDDTTEKVVDVFESGTRDQYGKLASGDDMIIWYYDLEGKPVKFIKPRSSKEEHLCRIRWQNPDLHRDKSGRPIKYSSPCGSGSHLFIPQEIRQIYQQRRVIKRLYIQEGEKKAIKACKHGMPSVGIMGIQNIGYQGKLPYELQLIIPACKIEEVIFVLDSDWDHLSNDLVAGSRVDQRPLSFYYAVRNFRDYFKTFVNQGIYLELYFAYIRSGSGTPVYEKGIDDLLAGSLKDNERALLEDINMAINEKDGQGRYIQIHKISIVSDVKLLEYWQLTSVEAFSKKYQDILAALPEFTFGKHKWRLTESGKPEPAQPLQEDEQYWEKLVKSDRHGNDYNHYQFNHLYCYNFLHRRGFGRIEMASRQYLLGRIIDKTVHLVEAYQIRDFIIEFTKEILDREDLVDVMNMLYRGGRWYFGCESMSNLDYIKPVFEVSDKSYQYLFFKDKFWKITADGIEEKPLSDFQYHVWNDKINDFDARLLEKEMVKVDRIDCEFIKSNRLSFEQYQNFIGQFDIEISQEAQQCHFLRFLINTGEFFWTKFQDPHSRKPSTDARSLEEKFETNLHLVSKMTAIGYLLHKYRDKSCEKAVIAMDGRLSEVGESNGRTGKSILGFAIGKVIPQTYIGAKSKDLESDPFIFEEVTEKTDNIFLDDVRANIDFEFFFPIITGKITVNSKGQKKYTLSERDTPKLYITTNHAINGSTSSFKDRQALIAFSDYYNEEYKPVQEFGVNFFDEWDEKQWNLFYNFMADCLRIYFLVAKSGWGYHNCGLIQPPTDRLDRRRLRQFIGEDFLTWAGEYFNVDDPDSINGNQVRNMNIQIPRGELYVDFLEKTPTQRKYITAHKFKRKIIAWCEYYKARFNPVNFDRNGNPGAEDKRHGIEYFTIANDNFENS